MSRPLRYDPYDWAMQDAPFETWRRLRDEAPVFRNEERDFWALSRYSDVRAASIDWRRFISGRGVTLDSTEGGQTIINMDPPRHTELRSLVNQAFTARQVGTLEGPVRDLCRQLLDDMAEAGEGGATVDFTEVFSNVVPMAVIVRMLGVPAEDRALYQHWIDTYLHRNEGDTQITPEGRAAAGEAMARLTEVIAERRRNPGGDLLSRLVEAEIDGQRMDDDELLRFCFLLLIAGYETTTKLMGTAAYWLWRFPDQRRRLVADPALVPSAVEEVLRFDGSTPHMVRRTATDVTLHDVTIPEGAQVMLLFGSANRDERQWTEPDTFDVARNPQGHLAFGYGIHLCVGAAVARLEAKVAFEEFLARFPDYDIDETGLERARTDNNRGFARVPMRLS